jgi:hypothetical protein
MMLSGVHYLSVLFLNHIEHRKNRMPHRLYVKAMCLMFYVVHYFHFFVSI